MAFGTIGFGAWAPAASAQCVVNISADCSGGTGDCTVNVQAGCPAGWPCDINVSSVCVDLLAGAPLGVGADGRAVPPAGGAVTSGARVLLP